MNKKIIVSFLIVPISLSLTACSLTKPLEQKVGEKIMEKAIEKETGAKVDIDSKGDDITIKTDEGQTQYSSGGTATLPETFPKELIVVNDAKIVMSTSYKEGSTVSYVSDSTPEEIKAKQLAKMAELGWEKDMEINSGTGSMYSFSKDTEKASVNVGDNSSSDQSGKSFVNVIYSNETE